MQVISDENIFYRYSTGRKPVASIESGETLVFTTLDCLSNVLKKPTDKLENTSFDKEKVNPVTGPVYVSDAKPGDALEISIDKIELARQAVITCQADYPLLGDYFKETTFKITPIVDEQIIFDQYLTFPADKMIGVIAVTPLEEGITTGMAGSFGGNLDNTMLREGAKLYLPVFVEGALLGCGDVHARMGDGEINCSALEAAASITLTVKVRKDLNLNNPVVITDTLFMTIASEPCLDQAVETTVREMAGLLKKKLPIPFDQITMLMSAVGSAEICQVVGNLKTARYCMPRSVLAAYSFSF